MFRMLKNKNKYPAYTSKGTLKREKRVIILMIPNREGQLYLALKKSSALLRAIMSKNNGTFCCLNCLYSFRTKIKPESLKKLCQNKDFCGAVMTEDTKILEFNKYEKSKKTPSIIYADLEYLIKKWMNAKIISYTKSRVYIVYNIVI